MEDVTKKADNLQTRVETLEKENSLQQPGRLQEKMESPESQGFPRGPERISPDISDQLPLAVDIAYHMGSRFGEDRFSRRIVIQFLS